ncbi:MAG: polysaccharide biosynthesis C-terminal domain-containing protein, partial [Clostridia bacterium]|nr:polysaccharide biosynthesis C-terminal domain-containing protein [Clostridia bacterium]
IGAFPMAMFKLLGIVLISQGKRGAHFVSLAVSAAINVAANIYAIPIWGMYGAAWASVLSYTVCGTVLTAYFCKTYSFGLKELFLPSKSDIAKIKKLIKRK